MTEGRDESNEGPLNELNALRHRVEVLEVEHGKYEDLEDALRESEERFRLLMDQGTDAFVLHDVHGKIVEVNRTACEALGYSRDELLGIPVWDFVEEMPEEGSKAWAHMTLGVTVEDVSIWKRKNGTTFPVEVRLQAVELNGQWLVSAIARDVAERQETQRAIREGEERFRTIIEESADGFILHDMQGMMVDANRMACSMLGYSREQLLSMPVWEFVDSIPKGGTEVWEQMVFGKTVEDEVDPEIWTGG